MAPINTGYTRTAVVLHWLAGALILCGFALGLSLQDLPLSPQTLRLYGYHKWIGITVFLLAVTRLAWRVAHPPRRSRRCRHGSGAPPPRPTRSSMP